MRGAPHYSTTTIRLNSGLDLSNPNTSYTTLTTQLGCGQPLVSPGSASGSYLIAKLTGTGICQGNAMPPLPARIFTFEDFGADQVKFHAGPNRVALQPMSGHVQDI